MEFGELFNPIANIKCQLQKTEFKSIERVNFGMHRISTPKNQNRFK